MSSVNGVDSGFLKNLTLHVYDPFTVFNVSFKFTQVVYSSKHNNRVNKVKSQEKIEPNSDRATNSHVRSTYKNFRILESTYEFCKGDCSANESH